MKQIELKNKILDILKEQFPYADLTTISVKSTFKEVDDEFDDLDLIEIVMEVEDEFDICIDDSESEKWKTVQDIIISVSKKIKIEIEMEYNMFNRFEIMDI